MTTTSLRWASLAVVALLSVGTAPSMRADTMAFTFDPPAFGTQSVQGNDGFLFGPTCDIIVTALGYYDHNQTGLTLLHDVGIFDVESGNLLAVTTLDSNSTLDGLFRYNSIDPLLLNAGQSYIVVGHHPGSGTEDLAANNPPGLMIAPEITFEGYFYNYDSVLSFPTVDGGSQRFFGPNFEYQVP